MRSCVVGAPQGLGDLWWVYQKLYDYFDEINLNIYVHNPSNEIELRSQKLFKPLPKINNVTIEKATKLYIHRFCQRVLRLDEILAGKDNVNFMEFDFICNRWLEGGNYLETLDRNYHVNWDIPIPLIETKPFEEPYMMLYVSGDTRKLGQTVWPPSGWVQLVNQYRQKMGVEWPVLMIGASFDSWAIEQVTKLLDEQEIPYKVLTDLDIREIAYLIKNAEIYIGYQSGLNILANHLDTKQLIVYFNVLPNMKDSWAKPQNRTNGLFNYVMFQDGLEPALKKLLD